MSDVPGKTYFSSLSRRTGFKTDSLEKVFRIIVILGRMRGLPELADGLALKGGTALHGLVFGFRRLSVDIDLNYIGSIDRETMQKDREDIRSTLLLLFRDLEYRADEPVSMYAEEQFNVHYTNCGGGADRLKLEINYLERLPVLGTVQGRIRHPFEGLDGVDVLSYRSEELFAGKLNALLSRATPRDIYDADLIAGGVHPFDGPLLRKMTLFFLSLSPGDVRTMRPDAIEDVTDKNIRDILRPMLSRTVVPDLAAMKKNILGFVRPMLDLTPDERRFFDAFYGERRMEQDLLFGELSVPQGLSRHPAIVWRLMQLSRKTGGGYF